MMKLRSVIFLLVVVFSASAQQKDSVTIKDYTRAESFLGYKTYPLVYHAAVNPHWLANDHFWYAVSTPNGTEYVMVDPAKGTRSPSQQKPDETATPGNVANKKEVLSPDGKKAAFIKEDNLWVRDVSTNQLTQLTTDGVKDYGYATDNAGWKHSDKAILRWSPDSKKIATFKQDQRKAGDMYLVTTNVGHPTLQSWKYPLPGDTDIITIERVIINVDMPKVIKLQVAP